MAKPTDIRITSVKTDRERIAYRAPIKFGGRVVTDAVIVNVLIDGFLATHEVDPATIDRMKYELAHAATPGATPTWPAPPASASSAWYVRATPTTLVPLPARPSGLRR